MPGPLDLSRSKMLVPPTRMSLRRGASYNNEKHSYDDRSPLSSTSSRFSFNHLLLASPPASPSLPALVPPPKKTPTHPRPSRVFRGVLWLSLLMLLLYFATFVIHGMPPLAIPPFTTEAKFEIVGLDGLPDSATPIVVMDAKGHAEWTVSIPPESNFPLVIEEYRQICSECREAASRVRDLRRQRPLDQQATLDRQSPADRYFMDVFEAGEKGILSAILELPRQPGSIVAEDQSSTQKPVCESSMTFVLETLDAGLGNTLMELWIFYGLALKQGRAFFIDDSRWAYGKYTETFRPPPGPDCRPPPRHHMLPCPTQARHLVVSSETIQGLWAETLYKPYPRAGSYDTSSRELYHLAFEGYNALFRLNEEDALHIQERTEELKAKTKSTDTTLNNGKVVGMHVRHGDRHPLEYQYHSSYIPITAFTDKASSLVNAHSSEGFWHGHQDDEAATHNSIIVVASDDPTVYDSEELVNMHRAQDHITLAGKPEENDDGKPGAKKKPNPRVMHRFKEEGFGWEGGFYAPMFWNLGLSSMSSSNAGTEENMRMTPSEDTLRLRVYIARAYMMDLAVLAQASDHVVCTVSAMGCRLLAVMMGWERAMESNGWVNIDGDHGWTALTW